MNDNESSSAADDERGYTPGACAAKVRARGLDFSKGRIKPEPMTRDPHRGSDSYEASMLRNLLARIHGDGGHYVEEHGLDKALERADELVAEWRSVQPEPAQPAQQPVAWHKPGTNLVVHRDIKGDLNGGEEYTAPLYAAAQPAPVQASTEPKEQL